MHELTDDVTQVSSLLSYYLEKEELKLEKYKTEERAKVEEENRKIENKRSLQLSKLGIIATAALSLLGLYGTNFSFYDGFKFFSLETLLGFIFIVIATLIALEIHSHVMNKE